MLSVSLQFFYTSTKLPNLSEKQEALEETLWEQFIQDSNHTLDVNYFKKQQEFLYKTLYRYLNK